MKELLNQLNPWWEDNYEINFKIREKYIPQLVSLTKTKEVIFLIGLRRVGKTTLLKQTIHKLLKEGIDKKHIFYASMDMLAFNTLTIYEIIREFKKLNSIPNNEQVYLFLDEITSKEHFNQELKNLYDLGNFKLFVSSSSASALRDKGAFLTGRVKYIEIEPLDFKEFCLFRNYNLKSSEMYLIENYFEEYMEIGGMPEYVLTKDPTYITDLVNNIVLKDIIAKHNLKNNELVFDLLKLLLERVGKKLSYTKLSKILNLSKDTIQSYINYFIETYLFSKIELHGKLNEVIKADKKFYCGDVGIKNVLVGFRDKGAIYENLVYNKIKSENPKYYSKDGFEIDFITKTKLIEAKYGQTMNENQKELFNKVKLKTKIIANGYSFFLDED
ncbi:MAG: ATP-binding protein [Candidatus Nanoarchaeia archaeon]|nr:ATP-binding protein [Candidatus Nanoarchaeia archaeon]